MPGIWSNHVAHLHLQALSACDSQRKKTHSALTSTLWSLTDFLTLDQYKDELLLFLYLGWFMYLHVSVKCALRLSHFKHFNLLELVHYNSAHTVWHAQNSLFEFWMYTVPQAAPLPWLVWFKHGNYCHWEYFCSDRALKSTSWLLPICFECLFLSIFHLSSVVLICV